MSDAIIHHINISYDESDPRVVNFIAHLKRSNEELEEYYEQSLKEPGGRLYVSDKEGNEFTLVCNSGHNCMLTLRGMENI